VGIGSHRSTPASYPEAANRSVRKIALLFSVARKTHITVWEFKSFRKKECASQYFL
jgi:hypothetical protein